MNAQGRVNQEYPVLTHLNFRSVMGREIDVHVFGYGEPTTMVIGGIHGNEPCGIDLAGGLIKEFKTHSAPYLESRVVVIPKANPDGFIAGTRVNARGVDINRNFPTKDFHRGTFTQNCNPGKLAASEPETNVILQMAAIFRPQFILSFHAELGCVNYDGPGVQIAQAIAAENGLPVRKDLGYATPGSLGTYFGVERNIPVITLELLSQDEQWTRHGKAILKAIRMSQSE